MLSSIENTFTAFNAWLIGHFPYCKTELRNLGVNRDLPGIKLEGLQCGIIQEAQNALFRVYNKGNYLRFEHHYSGSVSLKDVFEIEFKLLKETVEAQNKNRPVPNLGKKR